MVQIYIRDIIQSCKKPDAVGQDSDSNSSSFRVSSSTPDLVISNELVAIGTDTHDSFQTIFQLGEIHELTKSSDLGHNLIEKFNIGTKLENTYALSSSGLAEGNFLSYFE